MAKSLSITPVSGLSRLPWRAYLEMTKPKVVTLMLLTVLVGMCLALPGAVPLQDRKSVV